MKKILIAILFCASLIMLVESTMSEEFYNEPENSPALPPLPKVREFNQAEKGEGTFKLTSSPGPTVEGTISIIYYDDEANQTVLPALTRGFNSDLTSFIYVDGVFLEALELSNTVTEFYLQELPHVVEEGIHEIQLVQFKNSDQHGEVMMLKKQQYEIKVK